MSDPEWKDFNLTKLLERAEAQDAPYSEFLRVPQLSCGLYTLNAGAIDRQTAHDEDEVYIVLRGQAKMVLGEERKPIGPGSIVYVPADTAHQFIEIEEGLSMLVFFGSGGPSGAKL